MNAEQIVKRYNQLCTHLGESSVNVILSAGAAMVLLGFRDETNDLDVDVPSATYKSLETLPVCTSSLGEYKVYGNYVDLHALDTSVKIVQTASGPWIYHPMDLLNQKVRLLEMPDRNPEKIARDIKELDDLIFFVATHYAAEDAERFASICDRANTIKANRIKNDG